MRINFSDSSSYIRKKIYHLSAMRNILTFH